MNLRMWSGLTSGPGLWAMCPKTTGLLGSLQHLRALIKKQRTRSWNSSSHISLCVLFFACAHFILLSHQCSKRFLCAPAGQLQQHRHHRHFCGLCRSGKLHRSACHLSNSSQHLRRSPALGLSPCLLPELGDGKVKRHLQKRYVAGMF